MPGAEALLNSPRPKGVDRRSPPALLQQRQAAPSKNRTLPFRELQLDRRTDVQREPPVPTNQHEREKEVGDISIGFSPDMRTATSDSRPQTPLAPRSSIHAVAKLRDARLRDMKRQPPIEVHRKSISPSPFHIAFKTKVESAAFASVPEEDSLETQNTTMEGNRF